MKWPERCLLTTEVCSSLPVFVNLEKNILLHAMMYYYLVFCWFVITLHYCPYKDKRFKAAILFEPPQEPSD